MTAELILAALIALWPPKDDPEEWRRYATIAVAFEDAVDHQMARGWNGSRAQLEAAGLTVFEFESKVARRVHTGEKRGGGRGVCLAQIEPTNKLYLLYGDTIEDLAGTDYSATLACLQTMTRTLAGNRHYCRYVAKPRWKGNLDAAMWRMYATGSKCYPTARSRRRAEFMHSVMGRVWEVHPEMVELVRNARLEAK